MTQRILVVDDEESIRRTFTRYLKRLEYEVEEAPSAEAALNLMAEFHPDLVITDYLMPGMDGLTLLRKTREVLPDVDVVLITGYEDMQTAVDAMKAGAYDYLAKPLNLEQIRLVVERSDRDRGLRRRAEVQSEEASVGVDQIIGRDRRMIEIYKLIGTLSQNRAPALIRGETGTGKELIARAIHFNSDSAEEPFVAVNCTALAETLLESELFGHVKGSFTGAVADRKGRFEVAGQGTIFLDEIGDTTPSFQAKLLRVLQDGEYYPVGGERPRRTQARVLAATHRALEEQVREGSFREDLYFRLRVVEIVVPPLRERKEDIPRLARHLLTRIAQEMHKDVHHIAPDVMERLVSYPWPGNVRELENVLTRAVVMAHGPAVSADTISLVGQVQVPDEREVAAAGETLADVERAHVQRMLYRMGGNKTRTAQLLEISRPRLDRLIEKYALIVPE